MIQNLRQIKSRIKSIENTRKITRAMETISAAKLNRVKNSFYSARSYSDTMGSVLGRLLSDVAATSNPFVSGKTPAKSIALCIIASDTGLCGTYNANIIRAAEEFINNYKKECVKIVAVGKEAFTYFRNKGYSISRSHIGLYGRYSMKVSADLVEELASSFLSGEADEAYAAYTHFRSSLRHSPVVEKILNIEKQEVGRRYYILEPDAENILADLIKHYLAAKMNTIIMDAFTAEHSARMLAMKTATDNADDLVDALTLMRNKARQASITKEVLEIALAAEAVKE